MEQKESPRINSHLTNTFNQDAGTSTSLPTTPYAQDAPVFKSRKFKTKRPFSEGSLEWLYLKRMQQQKNLSTAAALNDTDKVLTLLKEGADPSAKDNLSRTPLHLAASKGYIEVVRLLLAHGGDVSAKDSIGNTPLHLAICTSHIDVVTELIKAGSDVSNLDRYGKSPLQLAHGKLRLLEKYLHNSRGIELKQQLKQIIDMMTVYAEATGKGDRLVQNLSSLALTEGGENGDLQARVSALMETLSSLDLK